MKKRIATIIQITKMKTSNYQKKSYIELSVNILLRSWLDMDLSMILMKMIWNHPVWHVYRNQFT